MSVPDREAEGQLTEEEKIIGGIHAKLLLGRGRFTRIEADVLLQSHDALRARLAVLERERDEARGDQPEISSVGSPGIEVLMWRGKTYVESRRGFLS